MFEINVPGDKSITHRALILAGIAEGVSKLRGLLPAADPRTTCQVLRELGCAVPDLPHDGGEVLVEGVGLRGLRAPSTILDCGNSGTTARLLLGLLSGSSVSATLTGDDSLRSRPMRRVTEPLMEMGAEFRELGKEDRLPIRVHGGKLRPLRYHSPRPSAQVKSALLLAGLTGGVPVKVSEPYLSRDHTERMLKSTGVTVLTSPTASGGVMAASEPVRQLEPLDMAVPGDPSSAAFFVALATLGRGSGLRIVNVGVNPTRVGFLDVLFRMGADVRQENKRLEGAEPVADLLVTGSALRGVDVAESEVPALIDEVPLLAVLASRAEGEFRIRGASELRVKESDRIAAVVENLRAIGCEAEETVDGMVVRGSDGPLEGRIRCFGDHRIAMAFGVLAVQRANRIEVDDPGVVGVSYPGFWTDLQRCVTALSG